MFSVNILSFCVLALSVLTSADRDVKSMLSQAVGGIRIVNYGDTLPMIAIGKWLFLISVFLLNIGIFIENEVSVMGAYVIPRYSSYRKWWSIKESQILILCSYFLISGIASVLVLFTVFKPTGTYLTGKAELLITLLCLLIHLFLLGTLLVSIFVLTYNRMISVIAVIALEGVTMIIGTMNMDISRYMPGMWGMYLRSSFADVRNGFDPATVFAVQLVISGALIVLLPALLRKRGTAVLL
jgi:hypothetical protein